MNRAETLYVMSVLKEAYPAFYTRRTEEELEPAIKLWQECFADEPMAVVLSAVKAVIITREDSYPPAIGEIKAKIRLLTQPEELDEAKAWSLVAKACQNGIYGSAVEFAKLPPDVQQAVGDPAQIKAWALMDEDTLNSVVASNFKRAYRIKQQRSTELSKLPQHLTDAIKKISEGFARKEAAICSPSELTPATRTPRSA